jgi:hypothetical protein
VTENLATLRAELAEVGVERFTARDYRPGTVTHIVLFRFREDVTAADRETAHRRFRDLALTERDGQPYIVSIIDGEQISGEAGPNGFEHAYIVTFASQGDRNWYVGEPVIGDSAHVDTVHAAFKAFVGPLLAEGGALVVDFQS